jgi:hypothetical protein
MHADCQNKVLDCIVQDLRAQRRTFGIELIRRAVARGDVPENTPAETVIDLLTNTMNARVQAGTGVPAGFLEAIVDIVLAGGIAVGRSRGPTAPAGTKS